MVTVSHWAVCAWKREREKERGRTCVSSASPTIMQGDVTHSHVTLSLTHVLSLSLFHTHTADWNTVSSPAGKIMERRGTWLTLMWPSLTRTFSLSLYFTHTLPNTLSRWCWAHFSSAEDTVEWDAVKWRVQMRDMTHSDVWHGSFIRVTWLIHMRDMAHSICVTWRIHTCEMTRSDAWHDSFICVTWLIHMCEIARLCMWHGYVCDMAHSYTCCHFEHTFHRLRKYCRVRYCQMAHSCVWHDSFVCVTWLIHMCDTTHSYVWHGSFICVTWLIHVCDMPHSYVWHDSFICVTWLFHMCDMPHSYVWHDSFLCV